MLECEMLDRLLDIEPGLECLGSPGPGKVEWSQLSRLASKLFVAGPRTPHNLDNYNLGNYRVRGSSRCPHGSHALLPHQCQRRFYTQEPSPLKLTPSLKLLTFYPHQQNKYYSYKDFTVNEVIDQENPIPSFLIHAKDISRPFGALMIIKFLISEHNDINLMLMGYASKFDPITAEILNDRKRELSYEIAALNGCITN